MSVIMVLARRLSIPRWNHIDTSDFYGRARRAAISTYLDQAHQALRVRINLDILTTRTEVTG